MSNVLRCGLDGWVNFDLITPLDDVWATFGMAQHADDLEVWTTSGTTNSLFFEIDNADNSLFPVLLEVSGTDPGWDDQNGHTGSSPLPTAESWQDCEVHYKTDGTFDFYIGGVFVFNGSDFNDLAARTYFGNYRSYNPSVVFFREVSIGTSRGASDLFFDDFSSGDLSAWTTVTGDATAVADPFDATHTWAPGRRVGVAFDDGPLEPDPTWTWLDDASVFPPQFVAGYDTKNGRQGLISQTETGTATVYVNDHKLGLFDDRNTDSPYYGKLDGRQIILQLWNPVTRTWEPQFRGWIENYSYDIDGSAVANPWAAPGEREPLNASIQIECVDMFDMLAGFGLTPGLAGVRPPSGARDGVWYAEATDAGRIIEVLADVGIDPSRTLIAEGNAHVIAVKYDPDESALAALRDAADAELPFIGNIYCDRYGRFVFRGRYSRFDPDGVAGEHGSSWDFTRWAVGDGAAITRNPARAQMRILSYDRDRQNIINAALCYPQGLPAADMPNQVYASPSSITDYGKHDAPPMSDLIIADVDHAGHAHSGWAKAECFRFAKLLVKNQAQPREAITALQVKAVRPTDPRAERTWAIITRSDIGHIVNVGVGYPGGTGFIGDSPKDDYYIEGRTLRVRPLNSEHDYVEYDINVSPAVWSLDTHGVFPPFTGEAPIRAGFTFFEEDTPGIVDFLDTSEPGPSGPITAWSWDFGDGVGTDTAENPTYTYTANGTYDVTLLITGTGGDGTDIETRIVRITDL